MAGLVDPIGWMVRQVREDIREPNLRIDIAVSMRALRAALARFRIVAGADQRWTFRHCNVRQLDTESFAGRATSATLGEQNRSIQL
jgi:hypothetical protein